MADIDIRHTLTPLIRRCGHDIGRYLSMLPIDDTLASVSTQGISITHCDVCLSPSTTARMHNHNLCTSCIHRVNHQPARGFTLDQLHHNMRMYRDAITQTVIYMRQTNLLKHNSEWWLVSCNICHTRIKSPVYEWNDPNEPNHKHRQYMSMCSICIEHVSARADQQRERGVRLMLYSQTIGTCIHWDLQLAIYKYTCALMCADVIREITDPVVVHT